jgi:2-hydroxychromene-2-carboxylate isomerase
MPKPQIDFFYFFGSGYAYLPVMRIDEVAERAGVEVRWRPFSVRTLMRENNIGLRNQPGKMRYIWRDIERRAKWHGIPFVRSPIWPTDPDELANRVAIVAFAEGWGRDYTKASFRSWYLDGQPLGEPSALNQVLSSLGRDPAEVVAKANSDETHAVYAAETEAARQLGIFGSPTFVAGGEVFWGDDRLEEALAWAKGEHPARGEGQE